jgi:hypothetical protein
MPDDGNLLRGEVGVRIERLLLVARLLGRADERVHLRVGVVRRVRERVAREQLLAARVVVRRVQPTAEVDDLPGAGGFGRLAVHSGADRVVERLRVQGQLDTGVVRRGLHQLLQVRVLVGVALGEHEVELELLPGRDAVTALVRGGTGAGAGRHAVRHHVPSVRRERRGRLGRIERERAARLARRRVRVRRPQRDRSARGVPERIVRVLVDQHLQRLPHVGLPEDGADRRVVLVELDEADREVRPWLEVVSEMGQLAARVVVGGLEGQEPDADLPR